MEEEAAERPIGRLVVGIDPGLQAGAIVLLSDTVGVLAGVSWSIRRRKAGNVWVMKQIGVVGTVEVPHLRAAAELFVPDLLHWTRAGPKPRLICEDLFGRGRTLQRLAESAGELIGALRTVTAPNVLRCHASTWRSSVLHLPGRSRSAHCDAAAIKYARSELRLDGALAGCGHAADAACIAAWGLAQTDPSWPPAAR